MEELADPRDKDTSGMVADGQASELASYTDRHHRQARRACSSSQLLKSSHENYSYFVHVQSM